MRSMRYMGVVTLLVAMVMAMGGVGAADAKDAPILEPSIPEYNNIPIPLHVDNLITRELGGRALNLDVYVGVYETYDDNVFQTANNKKDDFITTGLFGFVANYSEKDSFRISVPGQIVYNKYNSNTEQDGFEALIEPSAEIKVNDMLTFMGNLGYARRYDTAGPTQQKRFAKDDYSAGAGVKISPSDLFKVGVGGDYFNRKWQDSTKEALDYNELSGYVRPTYDLTPNSEVGVKLTVGKIDRETDGYSDASYVEVAAVYDWSYLDTAQLSILAGWANRDYDEDARLSDDDSDYNGLVVRLGGAYALGEGVSLEGSYSHGPNQPDSLGYNYQTVDYFDVALRWVPRERFRVSVRPYFQKVDPSQGNYYWEYGGGIGASYSLTELFSLGASYRIQHRDFESDSADDWTDNRFTLGLNLTL